MSRLMKYNLSLIVLGCLLCGVNSTSAQEDHSIEGVWQISKIIRDYEDDPITVPAASQAIFTGTHYSLVFTPRSDVTTAFETRWEPTDDEILKRFWEVTINTGTYTIDSNRLRIEPSIARFPEFIGGYLVYEIEWSGAEIVLTLIEEYSFDGVPNARM